MDNPKQTLENIVILTLLSAGIVYIYYWSSSHPLISFENESFCNKFTNTVAIDKPQDELEAALTKASMRNKTVIITMINKAYADEDYDDDVTVFDLFLKSFWLGEDTRSLLDHVLVVAFDRMAYDRCRFLRLNCFRFQTDGADFESEKVYMSEDFIKMMWKRTFFLLRVLKLGYSFLFTDTDVMWLRNPFTKLSNNQSEDLQISTDHYNGDPWSEAHMINTGFYFVRSNEKTISLFETWYGKKDNSTGQKEQDVLQDLIRVGIIGKLGLKVRFLDTLHFSGFCEDSKNLKKVRSVHANCCRSIVAKVADLKAVLTDWKMFRKNESDERIRWREHFECMNSWKISNNKKT